MIAYKGIVVSILLLPVVALLRGQTEASIHGACTIRGQVLFADGTPAHTGNDISEEVAVNIEVQTPQGTWDRFGGAAHTDARGHYQIEKLPHGRYRVFAAFPGSWVQVSWGKEMGTGPLIYAPGVVRPSKAQIVDLTGANGVQTADIRIAPDSHHKISGRVLTQAGEPVSRAIVRLYASGEPQPSRAIPLAENGTFEFANVGDEEYTISVSQEGSMIPGSEAATHATVVVHEGDDPEPLRLIIPAADPK